MIPRPRSLWFLLFPLASLAHAALYTDPSKLVKDTYDFIIVGAGTGGNVIANRLTENPSFSVLVIEAGVNNEGVLGTVVPLLAPSLAPGTPLDWNYTTTPQVGLNGRAIPYPRGYVLGGSSSINYMVYTRGSEDDFDRIAKYTGDQGWSWKSLFPYILKSEKMVPPADNHDTTGQYNPAVHGRKGLLLTSLPGVPNHLDQRVINSTNKREFPFNLDMNSGDMIGVGWAQTTIGNSRRSSSATAYLQPALQRPNLDVLINTHVTRLLQTGSNKGTPSFKKVELAQNASSKRFTATARKEVVLSAGAVNTPQILLLSGLGPRRDLTKLGIKPALDLPAIGQNLIDHSLACNVFSVNSTATFDDVFRNETAFAAALAQWNATGLGPLVSPVSNQIAWLRLPKDASIFKTEKDPSAGPTAGHYEILFSNLFISFNAPSPATGNYFTSCTAVVTPTSVGSITLNSTDPFDAPLIDPALFKSKFDSFTIVYAIKALLRFVSSPAWRDLGLVPFGTFADAKTDAQLLEYARSNGGTVFHPVGTAAMAAKGAGTGTGKGVVDSKLLVKGVDGVRVVDASVFPFIPSAHTQAPVYIIAERAADIIKSAYT